MSIENVIDQNLWDMTMGVPRRKFVVLNAFIREQDSLNERIILIKSLESSRKRTTKRKQNQVITIYKTRN